MQTLRNDTETTASEELGMEILAMVLRIAIARCQAYNMPLPEMLREAMRLYGGQAAEEPVEPPGCGAADDTEAGQGASDEAGEGPDESTNDPLSHAVEDPTRALGLAAASSSVRSR